MLVDKSNFFPSFSFVKEQYTKCYLDFFFYCIFVNTVFNARCPLNFIL